MAVAVKNKSETRTTPLLDRLPVSILMGVAYVLGSLGIIFPLLDYVWWTVLRLDPTNLWMMVSRIGVGAVVAGGLVYVGLKLIGKEPMRGLCSGITLTVIAVLLAVVLTQAIGLWIENWVYASAWLGSSGWLVGVTLTAAVGVGLLALIVWALFKKPVERFFTTVDDQGPFTLKGYKASQGAKVRRGTMLALLIIIGTGIFSLLSSLESAGDWKLHIPFTGKVLLTPANVGDNPDLRAKLTDAGPEGVLVDRFAVRDLNQNLVGRYVKVVNPGSDSNEAEPKTEPLVAGQVIDKTKFEEIKALREKKKTDHPELENFIALPTADDKVVETQAEIKGGMTGAGNYLRYSTLTLLPHLKFTAPLLLAVLGLWFAWRVINLPAFADFLIATEAEMNKVSWTTTKRLIQDTVVVLACVILLTVFLFFADIMWTFVLQKIGVLQTGAETKEQQEPKW